MLLQNRLLQCQEQETTWACEKAQLKAGLAAALDQKGSADANLAAMQEKTEILQCQVGRLRKVCCCCDFIKRQVDRGLQAHESISAATSETQHHRTAALVSTAIPELMHIIDILCHHMLMKSWML